MAVPFTPEWKKRKRDWYRWLFCKLAFAAALVSGIPAEREISTKRKSKYTPTHPLHKILISATAAYPDPDCLILTLQGAEVQCARRVMDAVRFHVVHRAQETGITKGCYGLSTVNTMGTLFINISFRSGAKLWSLEMLQSWHSVDWFLYSGALLVAGTYRLKWE